MDPLSDVLSLLKPQSYLVGGFDAAGEWSIRFDPHPGIKCYAVVSGEAWLAVDGVEPMRLGSGDCFLLPRGRPFRVTSDLALPPENFRIYFPPPPGTTGLVKVKGGGDFACVGGHFALAGDHAGMLLGMLPPVALIRNERDKMAMRWSLARMRQELEEQLPGSYLVAEHLSHLLLLQALRLHLAEGGGVGWLFALADRQMRAAIGAMHADPARRWTLPDLAAETGMSRSSFALRFKATVGMAPMEYLTRWRMLRAGDRLVHGREPVAQIALSLGYESESAFSTAFKRVMGCAPRQYGRGRGEALQDAAE